MIMGDFNTLLTIFDKACAQISNDTKDLNNNTKSLSNGNVLNILPKNWRTHVFKASIEYL